MSGHRSKRNSAYKDLTGKPFGKWTVLRQAEPRRYGKRGSLRRYWFCQCACGTFREIDGGNLTSGHTESCGCANVGRSPTNKTHGMSETRVFRIWHNMLRRCYDSRREYYRNYGARGVTVCDRWRESFENFLADMGMPPSDEHTLERKEGHLGYEPSNCCWATRTEQANNRRTNVRLTFQDRTMTIAEWARELGIGDSTIRFRLKNGWSVERALTTPAVAYERTMGPLTHEGTTLPLAEWARRFGFKDGTLRMRLRQGFTLQEALTMPLHGRRRKASS